MALGVFLNQLANEQPNTSGVFLNTTGVTQAVAARFITRPGKVYAVRATIVATETATFANQAYYVRSALFKNPTGTLALVGSITSTVTIESDSAWDVTLDAAAEDIYGDNTATEQVIRVLVTGAAATAITWQVKLEVSELGAWVANYGPTT